MTAATSGPDVFRPAVPKPPVLPAAQLEIVSESPAHDDGELSIQASRLENVSLDVVDEVDATFYDCEISSSTVSGPITVAMTDCIVTQCRFSTPARLERLVRVRFVDCKFSATDFGAGSLLDVQFERCSFDASSLWRTRLRRVSFTSCQIEAVDMTEARLTDVSFAESTVTRPTLHQSIAERVDASAAAELIVGRADEMRGWLLATDQVTSMAVAMAREIGIVVAPDH